MPTAQAILNTPTDWVIAFEKSRELRPTIFQELLITDVPLPLRQTDGAIVSDCKGRAWLCEVAMMHTLFCQFRRYNSKILIPIYGPWTGRRPDMIALNEFESVMIEALSQLKTRSKAA